MAYSNDLRERVLKYVENGNSKVEAAGIFGVCLKTIWNWIERKKQGDISPKKKVILPKKIDSECLLQFVRTNPDAYLREIAEEFGVTIPAVFYACKRLKITLKKSNLYQERDEEKREAFKKELGDGSKMAF